MKKLKWGMIGGGEGSQIGPAHRLGSGLDGLFEFTAVFDGFTTKQQTWYYFIGQWAPGPLMTSLGGLLMLWVFFGAIVGGKKKKTEPEPPPAARRRGRR